MTGSVLEAFLAFAVGCTVVAAARRLRRGEIRVFRCPTCARATSRAYPHCRHCGEPVQG